jgi:hypothetical protein
MERVEELSPPLSAGASFSFFPELEAAGTVSFSDHVRLFFRIEATAAARIQNISIYTYIYYFCEN